VQQILKVGNYKDLMRIKDEYGRNLDGKKFKILVCSGAGCISSNCQAVKDSLLKCLEEHELTDKVIVVETGCIGTCALGPVIVVTSFGGSGNKAQSGDGPGRNKPSGSSPDDSSVLDGRGVFYTKLTPQDIPAIVSSHLLNGVIKMDKSYFDSKLNRYVPYIDEIDYFKNQLKIALRNCGCMDYSSLEEYIARDGYMAIARTLNEYTPQLVADEIKKSGLKGRGGAGFPTGVKLESGMKAPGPVKYLVCNADEGDPGAFMDRSILEGDPHSVIEGMLIGGYTIGAQKGYVYVRAEYPLAVERLDLAIRNAREAGLLGINILGKGFNFDIEIRIGAGAFVCGEETALMASIEGERGEPRQKPPFPFQKGLFGKPTIISNVETYANIPPIILKGSSWFSQYGTENSKGTKVFALAGAINNTGIVEVPMGTTLGEIIFEQRIQGGSDRRSFRRLHHQGKPQYADGL